MSKYLTLINGSILSGIGLICLALYQFVNGDVATGVQSVLAALASFGVTVGLNQHAVLKEQLNRKGIL